LYTAHSRRTPNALHVSVRRKQKRFQRASEAANSRISQIVRQRVPHRRTGHGKCPSAVGCMARHPRRGSIASEFGASPLTPIAFDVERTNSAWQHRWEGCVFNGQPRPIPKGGTLTLPTFGVSPYLCLHHLT